MRHDQGHLNCLLRPPPSLATEQNVKTYKAPTPGLENATWASVNCLHSAFSGENLKTSQLID